MYVSLLSSELLPAQIFHFFCFVQWPTNAQLIDKLSHSSYMFRHCCVILREFVVFTLQSYTSMSNAVLGNYLLTPWCRVLLEKLTGLQLVKKFPEFHGTRRFITALTGVRHLSLSWASPIQSIYPHPTSWRSVLILSTHLRLGLPSSSFPPVSPPKPYTPPSPQPYAPHAQPI